MKPLVRLSPNSYGIVLVVGEVAASGVAAVLAVEPSLILKVHPLFHPPKPVQQSKRSGVLQIACERF